MSYFYNREECLRNNVKRKRSNNNNSNSKANSYSMYSVPGIVQMLYILALTTDLRDRHYLLSLFYRWGKWGTERFSNLPKAVQLIRAIDVIGAQHTSFSVHVPYNSTASGPLRIPSTLKHDPNYSCSNNCVFFK